MLKMKRINDYINEKLHVGKYKQNKIDPFDYLIDRLKNTLLTNYTITKDSFKEFNGSYELLNPPTHYDYYQDLIDELEIYKELYKITPHKNDVAGINIKNDNENTYILFQFEHSLNKILYIHFSKNIVDRLLNEKY